MDNADILLASVTENLFPARMQMAISLGWHIIFSCFGMVFPALVVYAEWRSHRRGDAELRELAHTWAKAMGILFAAGAVSGTVLSFEMGILWPGLMERFGEVYGFPFVLEGFAFFIEAIFVGVYLFGWDRMSPRAHMLSALPMVISGQAGAFFVLAANGWMNTPTGFDLDENGNVINVDPVAAMFNPSTIPEYAHMVMAGIMVTGFLIASVYAVGWLRGRRDRYHRMGLMIPLVVAAVATPIQIGVGDWIANVVADEQPVKLAAMEGLNQTGTAVPLSLGGLYIDGELRGALEIPWGLSLLVTHDPNGRVIGLDAVPPELRPPVNVVHLSYNLMVAIGFAMLLITAWLIFARWRKKEPLNKWFLRAVVVSGPAAVVAMECGWITTEVGRQPWIVYEIQKVEEAVSTAPGLPLGLWAVLVVYTLLTWLTVYVLRRLAKGHQQPLAPQEQTPAGPVGQPIEGAEKDIAVR